MPAPEVSAGPTADPVAQLEREPNRLKRLFKVLGPGLITGAADDDPSAVSTYSVAGAGYGFAVLWTAPLTLPLMATVVYICGKIGMVTGLGLGAVLRGTFIPTFSADPGFIAMLLAILGTTISPYLYFWQAGQQVEEEVAMGRRRLRQRQGATDTELKHLGWDVNSGMFFSNLVMYFIMLGCAATLHAAGRTDVQSASEAAEALRPLAG